MVLGGGRLRIATSPCRLGLGFGCGSLGPEGTFGGVAVTLGAAAWAYDGACRPLLSPLVFLAGERGGGAEACPPSSFFARERTISLNSLISFSCADTLATTSALSSALNSFISVLISSPRSETMLLNSSSIMPS
jgi:hypothetical protein